MKTLVAMPMKDAHKAKSRLAGALSPGERRRLALTLFSRSQAFLKDHFPEFTRLVVTPSDAIAQLAAATGAQVLREGPTATGLNAAATSALSWAREASFDRLLLVPGDIPVWLVGEVVMLLEKGKSASVAIATAHDGGTNALLIDLRQVPHFTFHYGIDSAAQHQRWCRTMGISCGAVHLSFLSRDVDTEQDFLLLGGASRGAASIG